MVDGSPVPRRHLIITGTGRAGTTFLVQLFTALGMDTGFSGSSAGVFDNCRAGMERDLGHEPCPYIVKDPRLCHRLESFLRAGTVIIDHAIVPIRDLYAAAESRRFVAAEAGRASDVPGGLWLTEEPAKQESMLAEQFYKLFHTLAQHDVPTTVLHFPRLALDPGYLYRKLRPVLGGIGLERFQQAFSAVSQPGLIHDFAMPDTGR